MTGRRLVSLFLTAVLSMGVLAGCVGSAKQGSAPPASSSASTEPKAPEKPYYQGKSVTLIVPNSPGRGMDTYARMIVPYLQKHLGASEVVVKNITGAGGIVGINQLWNSKPDGLTIAFTSVPTVILSQLAGSEGVQFDATKFTYLGRASTEARVLSVGGKSSINAVGDLAKLNRPFKFPTQGTDEDFYTMAILAKSLGFTLQTISGYEGNADTSLAVIKGDGDGHITALTDATPAIKAKDKRAILMIASQRDKEYPDVPTATEVVQGSGQASVAAIVAIMEMHRSFFGPPNMDAKAAEEMRKAVGAALQEQELLAKAASTGLPISFLDGGRLQGKVAEVAKEAQNIVPVLKDAVKSLK